MEEINKGGRPTKYDPKMNKQAYELTLLGYTDKQLADFFYIAESTLNNWKIEYPLFLESIKKGKEPADAAIALSLFNRAKGTSIPDSYPVKKTTKDKEGNEVETVEFIPMKKHLPPDVTAQIFWLKNRQPEKWRDSHSIEGKIKHQTEPDLDLSKLTDAELETLAEIQSKARISTPGV